jgi:hypothetical protein
MDENYCVKGGNKSVGSSDSGNSKNVLFCNKITYVRNILVGLSAKTRQFFTCLFKVFHGSVTQHLRLFFFILSIIPEFGNESYNILELDSVSFDRWTE